MVSSTQYRMNPGGRKSNMKLLNHLSKKQRWAGLRRRERGHLMSHVHQMQHSPSDVRNVENLDITEQPVVLREKIKLPLQQEKKVSKKVSNAPLAATSSRAQTNEYSNNRAKLNDCNTSKAPTKHVADVCSQIGSNAKPF
ncbi:hypothetical protein Ddye_017118 [Dipteronia dyeriana]|uniref:Uncharacterized protein n=1 Tax=Dipteronia dyeriana TaxID=168575 RepID=A0AAD9U8K9_9ROSI|nr:hypothetical protein Ddye_017118 [Dipteronia dyeriana]